MFYLPFSVSVLTSLNKEISIVRSKRYRPFIDFGRSLFKCWDWDWDFWNLPSQLLSAFFVQSKWGGHGSHFHQSSVSKCPKDPQNKQIRCPQNRTFERWLNKRRLILCYFRHNYRVFVYFYHPMHAYASNCMAEINENHWKIYICYSSVKV